MRRCGWAADRRTIRGELPSLIVSVLPQPNVLIASVSELLRVPDQRLPSMPYVTAVVMSASAFAASLLVGNYGNDVAPLLFLGSVAVTAWYGGLWPALLATVLGFLAVGRQNLSRAQAACS